MELNDQTLSGSSEDRSGRRRPDRRRGYILVAVLSIAALVTAVGISFLDSHSTAMPEAVNRTLAKRAQYLAESGVAIGMHHAAYPSSGVAADSYYKGAAGVGIDGGKDYTDIAVVRSDEWSPPQTDLNLYRVTALGVAHAADDSVGGKRTVTAEVVVAPTAKWTIPYALIDRDYLQVISRVSVTGNIHANDGVDLHIGSSNSGNVYSTATVRREVILNVFASACTLSNIFCNVSAVTIPTGAPGKYQSYCVNGRYYTAHSYDQYNMNSMSKIGADMLNGIDMSSTNPGRLIVYTKGNLKLKADNGPLVLNGGLIITNGTLELEKSGVITINAVVGYPAVVVSGGIYVSDDDETITLNGPVLCPGDVDLGSKKRVAFNVNGTLIKTGSLANIRTGSDGSNVNLTYVASRSWFWDVENLPRPMTVLSWTEQ